MGADGGFLGGLPDPRAGNARHRLGDVLLIAVAASLCGGETCVDFAQFGQSKRALLERLLGPYEPPSHDTFSRLFRRLDPAAFSTAFARFMAGFAGAVSGVVAVDGKALRRAHEAGLAAAPPLMVSAWAGEARLALAAAMPAGGNEVEAALEVLALLDLGAATVTADALHCHRRMAERVVARGGDYALCLKGNQSALKRAAEAALAADDSAPWAASADDRHGRSERRRARVVALPGFGERHDFPGARAVAEIVAERGAAAPTRRLFLLSRALEPATALAIVRAHWQIENRLHWSLDVVFGEDDLRCRKDHAPANIAILKRIALNLVNAIDDPKTPIRRRIKRCAWEDDYLIKAITHMR
jgi:predicted transposase YbfD/YdcC